MNQAVSGGFIENSLSTSPHDDIQDHINSNQNESMNEQDTSTTVSNREGDLNPVGII